MSIARHAATLLLAIATAWAEREERYRIQPLDVIEIAFRYTPEFDQTATVQSDGYASLRPAGELKLGGLTVPEATEQVRRVYTAVVRDPVVTLSLRDVARPAVTIGGSVARPGRVELRGPTTLTDLIAMAGGFGIGSKETEVLLFRRVEGELVEVRKVNVKRLLDGGHIEDDIVLCGGDAVYVAKGKLGKVDRFMQVSRLGMYFNPIPVLAK